MNSKGFQNTIISSSEEETLAWARGFSEQLQEGDCVFLLGNLGAGKTVVSRGICQGLGVTEGVHSPTYSIVHEYANSPKIYHIDLYRLPEGADFEEIGLDYYCFSEGISLIEWPERLGEWSLDATWLIKLEYQEENGQSLRRISAEKSIL